MTIDLDALAKQYAGRRVAELVLHHVSHQDYATSLRAMAGFRDELRPELHEPLVEMIDFFVHAPQDEQRKLFSADLGTKFVEIIDVEKGFLYKRYGLQVTKEEAFTMFNILIVNWALSCHKSPQTKAAMQKAAGISFVGRLFRG